MEFLQLKLEIDHGLKDNVGLYYNDLIMCTSFYYSPISQLNSDSQSLSNSLYLFVVLIAGCVLIKKMEINQTDYIMNGPIHYA